MFLSGIGCSVLALGKTRLLPASGQRAIAAFLIVLAVPCVAQLGIILNMLSVIPLAYAMLFILLLLLHWYVAGNVLQKLLPQTEGGFACMVTPLHRPSLRNVWTIVTQHIGWYFREALPLFMLATLFLFLAAETGLLELIQRLMAPFITVILGLPAQSVEVFVLGFLRRDYGAARLYEMTNNGSLNAIQVLVSLLVLTLSVPCVAAYAALFKEQGFRKGLATGVFILLYTFVLGGAVNLLLHL